MNLHFSKSNAWQSALIYGTGDTAAAILTQSFSFTRMLGVAFIAATLYTVEIPNYFRWINSRTESMSGKKAAVRRTIFAVLYFNPLWIARHLALIEICAGNMHLLSWNIMSVSSRSFLFNLPAGAAVNYFIQNKVPLRFRFLASSLFSAVMAVYYALSQVWFT